MMKMNLKKRHQLFGTEEWADYNINCVSGCSHDCKYCYAKAMRVQYDHITPSSWKNELITTKGLEKKYLKRKDGKRFMFPSTHDITPNNLSACVQRLTNLLAPGNEGIIVTKPHFECTVSLCKVLSLFKNQFIFRFTIGSSDSDTLRFWEPKAPDFEERLASLKYAQSEGYQTSVSCEPMLDNNIQDVVEQVMPHVTETVWIGKPNMLRGRLSLNGHKDEETITRADRLLQSLSDQYILDLYARYKDNPKIRWKESISKIINANS